MPNCSLNAPFGLWLELGNISKFVSTPTEIFCLSSTSRANETNTGIDLEANIRLWFLRNRCFRVRQLLLPTHPFYHKIYPSFPWHLIRGQKPYILWLKPSFCGSIHLSFRNLTPQLIWIRRFFKLQLPLNSAIPTVSSY
jgi:hypothetical protein